MEQNSYKELLIVEMELNTELSELINEILEAQGVTVTGRYMVRRLINNYGEERWMPNLAWIVAQDDAGRHVSPKKETAKEEE